jgi:hypothetical protein
MTTEVFDHNYPVVELAASQQAKFGIAEIHVRGDEKSGIVAPDLRNGVTMGNLYHRSGNGHYDSMDPNTESEPNYLAMSDSVLGRVAILATRASIERSEQTLRDAQAAVGRVRRRITHSGLPATPVETAEIDGVIKTYGRAYSEHNRETVAELKTALGSMQASDFRANKVFQEHDSLGKADTSMTLRGYQLSRQWHGTNKRLERWDDDRFQDQQHVGLLYRYSLGRAALENKNLFLSPARLIGTKPYLPSIQNLGTRMDDPDFWPQYTRFVDDFLPAYEEVLTTSSLIAGSKFHKIKTDEEYLNLSKEYLDGIDEPIAKLKTVNTDHAKLGSKVAELFFDIEEAIRVKQDIATARRIGRAATTLLMYRTTDLHKAPEEWYTPLPGWQSSIQQAS